jgi:glucosyl-3-phosphoglycerate synthase
VRPDVERWLHRRTSAAADWPLDRVLAAKGSTTVAVVLPALDEEDTVGAIVASAYASLVAAGGGAGLVDELVVLDSGSGDRTGERAAAAGATVVHRDEVLPEIPARPGKGEALWRAVAATRSDLVVFVDADLRSFTPSYVTGLVGPLLADRDLVLVKASYDRPRDASGAGGGRVTELVARPLLNLFWPGLAGVVQPLAGEYAARRSLLERLPFPTGYGVELALLVDTFRLHGLDGLAQVDLGVRLHRHQDDVRLGLMASELLQVALARLAAADRLVVSGGLNPTLTQLSRSGTAASASARGLPLDVVTHDVELVERPPLVDVPSYARGGPRGAVG